MRIEYKDHDFCKDKQCQQLGPNDKCLHIVCAYSAKAFHKWLKINGYKIIKECNDKCRIFGSEISFELFVPIKDIKEICQDIWDNPDKYSDYKKGSEYAYYKFLKFLWVQYPDGSEDRLVDLVDMGKK